MILHHYFHCRTSILYRSHHVHDRSLLPGHQGQRCRLPRADGDNPRCQFRDIVAVGGCSCCSCEHMRIIHGGLRKGLVDLCRVMDDFHGQMHEVITPNISATVFPGLISCFTRSEGARLPPDLACAAGALSLWSKVRSRNLSR